MTLEEKIRALEKQLAEIRQVSAMRGEAIAVLTEKWAARRRWHQDQYHKLSKRLRELKQERDEQGSLKAKVNQENSELFHAYRREWTEAQRLRALIHALPLMENPSIRHDRRDYQIGQYFRCETQHHASALLCLLQERSRNHVVSADREIAFTWENLLDCARWAKANVKKPGCLTKEEFTQWRHKTLGADELVVEIGSMV